MKPRMRICIPVFDNETTIEQVVLDCLEQTGLPVLVVDDGSHLSVEHILQHEKIKTALETRRLSLIRHSYNLGKGKALQSAFDACLQEGFTHALTIDGDGQHLASAVSKLAAAVETDPWCLVLGNRQLNTPEVPKVSRFGRRFSNFWVRYETGTPVQDSQSGFRAYPLFFLQGMRYWTTGFEFEIECLIRLMWKNVPVREVSVEVVYQKPSERVTHFNKFWDNLRISTLNTLLVTVKLFRLGFRPLEAGLAMGLGVVIGCTPFFGLHTVFATIFAVLFRLNVGFIILGTQVSIAPVAPFLALVSIRLGARLRGGTAPTSLPSLKHAGQFFIDWMLGSSLIGIVLGVSIGLLTFLIFQFWFRRKKTKTAWNGRMRGGVGNRILTWTAQRFGLSAAYFCLYFVVPYFYLFAPRARKALHEYWKRVDPSLGPLRRRLFILRHMRRFGQLILDRLTQARSTEPYFDYHSEGFEHIRDPLIRGEGVVLLTAHVGAWDLASSYVYRHNLKEPFHLVQYEAEGTTMNRLKGNAEPLPARSVVTNRQDLPILSMHRLLSDGQAVALMGDRPVGKHFDLVNFFGRLAPFDTTAFKLAAATGKPLVFTFGFKGQGNRYDFSACPAKYYRYETEDREAQCGQWAQEFASYLETLLRRYPDQWENFFPFWSTPPAPPA
jgi:predicted LPLAT superfamily acyltransferase/glycosyltransferase involved in cell wall biosynthesis